MRLRPGRSRLAGMASGFLASFLANFLGGFLGRLGP